MDSKGHHKFDNLMQPTSNFSFKNLGIKNFRSFDSEGIFLEDLNKINFLIGKNNSGKSNVLKFLHEINKVNGALGSFPDLIENLHNNTSYWPSISIGFTFSDLNFPAFFEYTTNSTSGQVAKVRISDYLADNTKLEVRLRNDIFDILFDKKNAWKFRSYENEIAVAFLNHNKLTLHPSIEPWDLLKSSCKEDFLTWLKNITKRIIYIPDIRIIKEKNNIEKSNSKYNGANIISHLSSMINYDVGEDHLNFKLKSIENKIAELLGVNKIKFHVPEKSKKEKLVLEIDDKRYPLENFGTGVHDLVILCCILLLNENSIVCIEEPELHLHPELQRRFLKFLLETDHQYFITTHSNVFLDYLNENISIYHVTNDKIKSKITKSINNNKVREIVDELGFKASDLLQSNGIIWVEGPSDRTYIKKWLSLISPDLEEGIHYSVMFYGGKLLYHLTFSEEAQEEFIKMLSINQNAFILIDKDKEIINKTKSRIFEEIGHENCWITKGKEIENYIPLSVINRWLKGKNGIQLNQDIVLNKKFEKEINELNPSIKYEKNKSIFANEISKYFTVEDLNFRDLYHNVNDLVDRIKKWNSSNEASQVR